MITQALMPGPAVSTALLLLLSCLIGPGALAAENPDEGDVRNLRIGMHVADIHSDDYRAVSCASTSDAESAPLAAIQQFRECRADSRGLHPLRMHYAPIQPWSQISSRFSGTKIAGHPVNLWIDVDTNGRVQSIRAETDEAASRYLRKKAFLLGLRVKARYGRENWTCERAGPDQNKLRVGGMFIDEVCEKSLEGRRLILQTNLYRAQGQEADEFVGSTRLQFLAKDVAPVAIDEHRN